MTKKNPDHFKPLLLSILFVVWTMAGMYGLWLHNDLLPWFFFIFALYFVIKAYYKFHKLEKILTDIEVWRFIVRPSEVSKKSIFRFTSKMWFLFALAPLPFMLYVLDWKILLVYMIIGLLWHLTYFKLLDTAKK